MNTHACSDGDGDMPVTTSTGTLEREKEELSRQLQSETLFQTDASGTVSSCENLKPSDEPVVNVQTLKNLPLNPGKGLDKGASSSKNPPFKTWNSLFPTNRNDVSCMKLTEQEEERCGVVHLDVNDVQLDEELKCCLIGCFTGRFPGKQAVYTLAKSWKVKHKVDFHPTGWVIFKFHDECDMENVLSAGPYFSYGRILILKKMPLFF